VLALLESAARSKEDSMRFTSFLVAVIGLAAVTTDAQAQLFRGRRAAQQPMMPVPMVDQGPMYFSPGSYYPTTLPTGYVQPYSGNTVVSGQPMSYVQPYQGNVVVSGQPVMPYSSGVIPAGYVQPSSTGMVMPTTPAAYQTTIPATFIQQYPGGPLVPVNPAVYTMPATSTGTTSPGVVTVSGTSTDSGGVVRTAGTTTDDTKTTETTTAGTTATGPIILPASGMVYGQPYFPTQGMVMPYGATVGGYQPIYTSGYTPLGGVEYIPVTQPTRRGLFGRRR
jgi:hypothetical protein